MSRQYKHGEDVPSDVLCARLRELSDAVTKGGDAINREFYMRIPAEPDNDADLVLHEAASRIEKLEKVALALVEKMDLIHRSEAWQSVWSCALNHGINYDGGTYDKELQAVMDELGYIPARVPVSKADMEWAKKVLAEEGDL